MLMAGAAAAASSEKFKEFGKKYGEKRGETDKFIEYSFGLTYAGQASRLSRQSSRAALGYRLVPRAFVVAMVAEFDAFIGRFLRAIFLRKPQLLNPSDRKLSVTELLEFESRDDALAYLIDKEVETALRKSHSDQFDWMETRFGIVLKRDLPIWPVFVELTERRNLFVHNNGKVSRQYLSVCKKHGVELEGEFGVGDQLGVTQGYFERAHSCVMEIGVKLSQVLTRKLFPGELEGADKNLTDIAYEMLVDERFEEAQVLLDFACCVLKKYNNDLSRRIFVVNRAQSYKWAGDDDKCRAILAEEDWTATEGQFRLAVDVLSDDFEKACLTMKNIGKKGNVDEHDYQNWPLFRKFRSTTEFAETFEDVFGRPFSNIEMVFKQEEDERREKLLDRFSVFKEEIDAVDVEPLSGEGSGAH